MSTPDLLRGRRIHRVPRGLSGAAAALLALLTLVACAEDKEPSRFPDVGTVDLAGRDLSEDAAEGDTGGSDLGGPQACDDHAECAPDELCFEDVCVDRDDALADCASDEDCPDGFVCEDQDRCVEE